MLQQAHIMHTLLDTSDNSCYYRYHTHSNNSHTALHPNRSLADTPKHTANHTKSTQPHTLDNSPSTYTQNNSPHTAYKSYPPPPHNTHSDTPNSTANSAKRTQRHSSYKCCLRCRSDTVIGIKDIHQRQGTERRCSRLCSWEVLRRC